MLTEMVRFARRKDMLTYLKKAEKEGQCTLGELLKEV